MGIKDGRVRGKKKVGMKEGGERGRRKKLWHGREGGLSGSDDKVMEYLKKNEQ